MTSSLRPGILGLGIIGSRVAACLRAEGFSPSVWNRTRQPGTAGWLATPAEVAQASDVIQIFVTDGPALLEVLEPLLPHLSPDKIVLNCATIAPEETAAAAALVAKTGAAFLDAPFTGSKMAAENGQLIYYIGGESTVLETVRPILEASSREILHTGALGTATVLKIATNMVSATTVGILAEAMGVVAARGIPLAKFELALEHNAASSGVSKLKIPSMIAADFDPHFSLKNMLKDAILALKVGGGSGLQLPILNTVAEGMAEMASNGHGDQDYSVMAANYLPHKS